LSDIAGAIESGKRHWIVSKLFHLQLQPKLSNLCPIFWRTSALWGSLFPTQVLAWSGSRIPLSRSQPY